MSYVPFGLSVEEAEELRRKDPDKYKRIKYGEYKKTGRGYGGFHEERICCFRIW